MRRDLLTLPLLLAVLALAACGDGSSAGDESAATPAATEAPTQAATPAAPAKGDAGVKVSGKLGAEPKITVPRGAAAPPGLLYKDLKVGKGRKAAPGET